MCELRAYIRWAGIALLAVPLGWGTALAGTAAAPGATSVIVQTTNAAILSWPHLVVPAGSTISFIQPTGIALNSTLDGPASTIFPSKSPVGVFIVGPSGPSPHPRPETTMPSNASQIAFSISAAHTPAGALTAPGAVPGPTAGDDLLGFATSVDATAPERLAAFAKLASAAMNGTSLPAATLKQVLDHTINTCGIVEATSAAIIDGQVVLSGRGDTCR